MEVKLAQNKLLIPYQTEILLVKFPMQTILEHVEEKIIGHLDMDAFFAAIEERDTPRWKGLPIVVGADPKNGAGRGVVSTANYAARVYGIRSAMPIQKAWQLAEAARLSGQPNTIFVGGNWQRYSAVSDEIMFLIQPTVSRMLIVGADEAYVDLTDTGGYEAAKKWAKGIRAKIWKTTRLTASVGVAPNKLVAKIASDYKKPNGFMVVRPEVVEDFLAQLPVRALPGVGPKSELALKRLGITEVAHLQLASLEWLVDHFGQHGHSLHRKVHGWGSVSLEAGGPAKSISEQTTFYQDTLAARDIIPQCVATCERVWRRVGEDGFSGWRTVTVMARFASFVTRTRALTLPELQTSQASLIHEALRLLLPFLDQRENPRQEPLRLIGVRVAKFVARE